MDSLFVNTKQAAAMLGFPVKTTRSLLFRNGFNPVDLGRGAGRGLRWSTSDVKKMADTLHAEAQTKSVASAKKKILPMPYTVSGKSVAELYKELKAGAGR